MPRNTSKHSRLMEEVSDLVNEIKATMKSHDIDLDECEMDEHECFDTHGEAVYGIYENLRKITEITEEAA